ncbi:MAG: energy-coupling factor transporter transmembrane protein EcfT, partial [Sphaerospermopsis sp. SIO1G2]|nr:energy-coupling factor transporter transmembrane protein EcfT [Sphaerospermopsis sp. SIO1G2]
ITERPDTKPDRGHVKSQPQLESQFVPRLDSRTDPSDSDQEIVFSSDGLLGAELIFLSLVALPLGWEKASFLMVRSLICLITMNSFLLTLPPHSFGIALKGLPIPAPLKENLLLAGQYLEILLSEITRMQRSAKLRGLNGAGGWLRYTSAAMIGALYIRTLDRAERVYGAMVTRGYHGQLPTDSTLNPKERFTLITVAIVATSITLSSYFTI